MTKLTIKKIFVYFLVIVLYFIFIHKLSWYTKEHVDKPKLPGRTEKQIATVGPGTTPTTTISQTLLLEGQFQKQIHSPSPLPQQKENSSKSPSHPLEPTGDISRLPSPLPKLTGDINKFPLTYMQASKYKGPIVEGWPPERNRSLDLYIRPKEDTFYMTPTSKAIKNCKFLIMIHTLPDFFESRTGIRNTYGRYLSEKLAGNTSLLFIIGNLKKANNDNYESTWNKLQKEQEIFGDILQADMGEHYNNLTLKTLFTLKYFLNTSNFIGTPPKYLMKVDDDTFVNVPRLWNTLEYSKEWSQIPDLVMGYLMEKPQRMVVNVKDSNKKFTNKWVCPEYMYNGKYYPQILSGSGYVMTRSAAECIYNTALMFPYFHLEDVLITGFAAEACNIKRRRHKGFNNWNKKLKSIKETDITVHYKDIKGKMEIYKSGRLKFDI